MKYLRILFSAAALLLAASCIENDIPYPTIELNIRSIEGEGFTVAGISLVNRTVTLTLDEKTDIRKVTIDKAEFDVATSNPMMTDKEKFISQIRTSQPLSGGVRPAGAALCHALALPGLRVDDRGRAAHSPVVHRRRADRIDTDRHAGAYGHGLCRRRHRPEGRHGHQPQAGACRHHRLLAHGRGTFRHGLRNGSSGRRHLPRPHGAVDAPCPAHQREDRCPRDRPL